MSKVSGIEQILVDSLDYKSMKKSMLKGKRKTVRLVPATNNSFTTQGNENGQRIHFDLPATSFLDTTNTVMVYNGIGNTVSDNPTLAFNNHAECIFNRVQWTLGDGSSIVEDLRQYNINSASMLKYRLSEDYLQTIAAVQQGVADLETRIKWCAEGRDYAVNFLASGIMNTNLKYLPLGLLAKLGGYNRALCLDIWLENPQQCMVDTANTSNKGYTISNIYLQMEMIEAPEWEEQIMNKIMSGQMILGIPFVSANTDNNQLLANQQGQVTFYIPNHYNEYMTGVRSIFIPQQANNVDYTNTFTFPSAVGAAVGGGLNGYQYLIKDNWYPVQMLDMTTGFAAQYNELVKYFGKNVKTYDRSVGYGLFNSTTNDAAVLLAAGNELDLTAGSTVVVDLTSSVFINQGWTVTTDSISPSTSGSYLITMSSVIDPSTAEADTTSIVRTSLSLYDNTNLGTIPSSVVVLNNETVTNTTVPNNSQMLTSNFVFDFVAGNTYSMEFTLANNTNAQVQILQPQFCAALLSPNESAEYDPSQNENFMIAQTFRIFYDCDDFLNDCGEFMLDGMNTTDSTPLTMRLSIGNQPSTSTISVIHYTDYIGCITIDSSSVNVMK